MKEKPLDLKVGHTVVVMLSAVTLVPNAMKDNVLMERLHGSGCKVVAVDAETRSVELEGIDVKIKADLLRRV